MITYTVPFLIEHEGCNGMTGISMVASLAADSDGCLANAKLVLGAGDSTRRGRH